MLPMLCCYFNSIKVQLELIYFLGLIGSALFQFHKGTIRTSESLLTCSAKSGFQFHKGTIRTTAVKQLYSIQHDFNSIKVQLELDNNSINTSVLTFISIP